MPVWGNVRRGEKGEISSKFAAGEAERCCPWQDFLDLFFEMCGGRGDRRNFDEICGQRIWPRKDFLDVFPKFPGLGRKEHFRRKLQTPGKMLLCAGRQITFRTVSDMLVSNQKGRKFLESCGVV